MENNKKDENGVISNPNNPILNWHVEINGKIHKLKIELYQHKAPNFVGDFITLQESIKNNLNEFKLEGTSVS